MGLAAILHLGESIDRPIRKGGQLLGRSDPFAQLGEEARQVRGGSRGTTQSRFAAPGLRTLPFAGCCVSLRPIRRGIRDAIVRGVGSPSPQNATHVAPATLNLVLPRGLE
jgi:hypothetical protein